MRSKRKTARARKSSSRKERRNEAPLSYTKYCLSDSVTNAILAQLEVDNGRYKIERRKLSRLPCTLTTRSMRRNMVKGACGSIPE